MKNQKKMGKSIFIYLIFYQMERKKGMMNTTEKTGEEMKQAVVNKFLKEGYCAPQNEIAKYITQKAYATGKDRVSKKIIV